MIDVDGLKRWHWAAVGLLAGLLVGWSQQWSARLAAGVNRPLISQGAFERELARPAIPGRPPQLVDVVVYRADGGYRVEMRQLVRDPARDAWTYRAREFRPPPGPYRPLAEAPRGAGPARIDYTVRDYLADVSRTNGQVRFRFAWWRGPWVTIGLWAAGGVLLVGGAWPVLLSLLTGAGFGGGRKSNFEPRDAARTPATHDAAVPTQPATDWRLGAEAYAEEAARTLGADDAAAASPAAAATARPPESAPAGSCVEVPADAHHGTVPLDARTSKALDDRLLEGASIAVRRDAAEGEDRAASAPPKAQGVWRALMERIGMIRTGARRGMPMAGRRGRPTPHASDASAENQALSALIGRMEDALLHEAPPAAPHGPDASAPTRARADGNPNRL